MRLTLFLTAILIILLPTIFADSNNLNVEIRRPESSYINNTVSIIANQTLGIDAKNETNTTLEIITSINVSNASVMVHYFSRNIEGIAGVTTLTGLNETIEIEVSNEINNNLVIATIKIYYNNTDLVKTEGIITESSLRMYRWNTSSSKWELLTSGVNTTVNYVWGNTTRFSSFGVFGSIPNEICCDDIDNDGDGSTDEGCSCGRRSVGLHLISEEIPATCSDGIRNQDEEFTDCGGPCPPCIFAPTCYDGIKNQGETEIDCGGACKPCLEEPSPVIEAPEQPVTPPVEEEEKEEVLPAPVPAPTPPQEVKPVIPLATTWILLTALILVIIIIFILKRHKR